MKNAFVCCTPFHVIVTLQLINTLFKDEKNDIFISNHFASAEKVFRNLKKESKNISNIANVFFVKDKEISYDKSFLKHKKIRSFAFDKPENFIGEQLTLDYDSLNLFTHSFFTNLLVNHSFKKNKKLSINFVEEGRMSYVISSHETKNRIKNIINKVISPFGFRIFNISLGSKLFLFQPSLYVGDFNGGIVKIPSINKNSEIKGLINKIFDYIPQPDFGKTKFIFFDQSFSIDGNEQLNEYKVIEDLIKNFNINDLLIKLHPRDSINKYEKFKLSNVNNSNYPWELIYLNENLHGKTLISINSSAVFTPRIIFGINHDIVLLKRMYGFIDDPLDQFLIAFNHNFKQTKVLQPESFKNIDNLMPK
ncbi:polysialyltransferase family glycosyltransferase [Cytobacillus oceanisediminis]|uniref:polysialyltransferase family glycosyltransferase n=1 Tax=Cytobacillus oceanisediminis TaxID=665099 RepID=UPI0011A0037B|nr:polysialyltransferase family glycosyltransferase [Cytobacillus oceanisediminis]